MYFGYGIKNSLLEMPHEQEEQMNTLKSSQSHQMELSIPKDVINKKLANNYNPNKNSKHLNGSKHSTKSNWQTFD